MSTSPANTENKSSDAAASPKTKAPWLRVHIWLGMGLGSGMAMLFRNRFQLSLSKMHLPFIMLVTGLGNTILGLLQSLIFWIPLRRTKITKPPLFIIGHWRTGTTYLHELLTQDDRHTFPNNFDCLCPHHFLLTAPVMKRLFAWAIPKQRPMDNMPLSWDRPQEDEFALCMLGVPSPYFTIAFPNRPPQYQEYFALEHIPHKARERWKRKFLRYITCLTYRDPKRVILKSPPHTFRVKTLLEIFPDARFVYIVRDPYVVFSSTVHLWKSLFITQGLQVPKNQGIEDYVYETFLNMHRQYEQDRALVPAENLVEIRYEDLVKAPLKSVEDIYRTLRLEDFETARPRLTAYLGTVKDYQTNRYRLTPEQRDEITRKWGSVIQGYGYREPVL